VQSVNRIEAADAEPRQGRLDAVDDRGVLANKGLPFPVGALRILLREGADSGHLAVVPLAAQPAEKGALELLGIETAGGSFNAVLRDYGRLGMLLADDGAVGGHQIIPKDYLIEATDWHRHPEAFAPHRATPYFGYGYQFWIYPGEKRRFALLGVYGQSVFVDPELKLVLVITAAARSAGLGKESLARERDALWRGLVARYGKW
jgi:CubicO group peptidase (beta-lactamase class C family)